MSQEQTDTGLALEVEITVTGCEGESTGTLEYGLVFADADGTETQWHITDSWDWRALEGPFTLQLHRKSLPNAQLQAVTSMKVCRCSCSTVVSAL